VKKLLELIPAEGMHIEQFRGDITGTGILVIINPSCGVS
tara:strand:+ start:436 stop:552 length:117 start_codon:yes stop_codon:yes gene_type:complete